jgi:hypothetical protein
MPIEKHIVGAEKLTAIYGSWPTFHDAEVLQIALSRDEDLHLERADWEGPSITAKFRLFIEAPTSLETIATIRFGEIDSLKLEGFNHQNALLSLKIEEDLARDRSSPEHLFFRVEIEEASGISASFLCHTIEVLDATPIRL